MSEKNPTTLKRLAVALPLALVVCVVATLTVAMFVRVPVVVGLPFGVAAFVWWMRRREIGRFVERIGADVGGLHADWLGVTIGAVVMTGVLTYIVAIAASGTEAVAWALGVIAALLVVRHFWRDRHNQKNWPPAEDEDAELMPPPDEPEPPSHLWARPQR